MTETFDVVVAGAGHNSLVAAAYLAKAGLSCVVLEASDQIDSFLKAHDVWIDYTMEDLEAERRALRRLGL